MKAIKRVHLYMMPFDKGDYSTGFGLVHSTGDMVQLEDGSWHVEYEDCIYEAAEGCIEEYEDEEGERK